MDYPIYIFLSKDICYIFKFFDGVILWTICHDYDPNSMNFDEYCAVSGTINGIHTAVIFRTYYP